MQIKQAKNSNRIQYDFGEQELKYTVQDTSGSRSFSVPYTDISRDRQSFEERNQWLGNVGLLWLALGVVMTGMTWFNDQVLRMSFWLWIGAGCYAVYWFRRTRFTIVPSDKGNLLVIDDADGPRILEEIQTRRAAQLRAEYDFMPEGDTPAQQRKRLEWLHREGALSDGELAERLGVVGDVTGPEVVVEARLLN